MAARNGAVTVSTYIVGFLASLADVDGAPERESIPPSLRGSHPLPTPAKPEPKVLRYRPTTPLGHRWSSSSTLRARGKQYCGSNKSALRWRADCKTAETPS